MRISVAAHTTLSQMFLARIEDTPHKPAYRQYYPDPGALRDTSRGHWRDITWEQAGHEVGRWRAALRSEGLRPGDRVALCMRNRVEWVLFDQAALGLGLVVVPLFYNDRPDNMAWCMNDAGVRLLLLEDGQLWRVLHNQVPMLARVVCIHSAPADDGTAVAVSSWLPAQGESLDPGPARAADLATLVYTSGTTGRPKGVMLSHRNVASNVSASLDAVPTVNADDIFLSFLPLSHMFERTVGYYLSLCIGARTVFARGIPELSEDLLSQRPTVLVCVPRIFERIYARMQESLPPYSLRRRLFDLSVDIGWRRFTGQVRVRDRLLWPVLDILVARKLRQRLGGRMRLAVSGAAALAPQLSRTFLGLGLPLLQGYGLTEFSPVVSCNRLGDNDPLSVGRPVTGIEARTLDNGELVVRGPAVMLGYWNNTAATSAVIDGDGWLHTGDIARIEGGRIYIVGRAKEIIVLSNGEKVPPADAEQMIMLDPIFQQVMVVGEGRPHLGLLVVSALADERALCQRANDQLRSFPGYARVRHIARISEPWTVENHLLTPTLKLRRNKIEERFSREIEEMYRDRDLCHDSR
ncbi:MAG: long-chain fatty acid--CoA ligase [Gammaproteobacteria bacterium]|nr:long-chain fatty acid--CoA ligase [Gammaproteobacteria bacterium]